MTITLVLLTVAAFAALMAETGFCFEALNDTGAVFFFYPFYLLAVKFMIRISEVTNLPVC